MSRRLLPTVPVALCYALLIVPTAQSGTRSAPARLERIVVSADQKTFAFADSGKRFVPWGFNYDHDENGRLIEEYWEDEWDKVVQDFKEMKDLGANVVRIHLQFGRFMSAPGTPNSKALDQLDRLVRLAEEVELYLDITGLACYLKELVPDWYDKLDEAGRWRQQEVFWEAVAGRCCDSSAIFCYDLMNEPVVPGGPKEQPDWLGPPFAGKFHFVQFITRELNDRARPEVARQWIKSLAASIRKHDRKHLITVGMVNWSLDRPGLTSGFVPDKVADELDFLSIHLYPEKGKIDQAIENLKGFGAAGKPVLIEETFTLKCSADDFRRFLNDAWPHTAGLIGFYWGKTPDELRRDGTIGDAIVLQWLELFQAEGKQRIPRG
jgi:Cellulase (glycosyl hydrolase family 5)